MREEELRLQVHLERLVLHALCRLPPSVRIAERRAAHGRRRVRLAWDSRVALAAFYCRAGLLDAGVSCLLVEAVGLREVGATHRLGAQYSAQGQVAHARVAGSTGAAALHSCALGCNFW